MFKFPLDRASRVADGHPWLHVLQEVLLELSILNLHYELCIRIILERGVQLYNFVPHDYEGLLRIQDLLDLLFDHQDLLIRGSLHLL